MNPLIRSPPLTRHIPDQSLQPQKEDAMDHPDECGDFLAAVDQLRDDGAVRLTAHTSSVSAEAWNTQDIGAEPVTATPNADSTG